MEHDKKKIESLVDKAFKDQLLEQPSYNFTSDVMKQVMAISQQKSIVYKPLISRKSWLVIAALVVFISSYVVLNDTSFSSELLHNVTLPELPQFSLEFLEFKVSKPSMYAIVFFAVMLFIQIPIIKNYYNSQLV